MVVLGCRDFFFHVHFTSTHTHASLLSFFFCFFILFHSCCSHARVFGKTPVHEFVTFYSHTELYFLFLSLVHEKTNMTNGFNNGG